jgi:hypothetical protein
MSNYSRLRAGYRLPAGKHAGILTDFQTKVKIKISHKEISHKKAQKGTKSTDLFTEDTKKLATKTLRNKFFDMITGQSC